MNRITARMVSILTGRSGASHDGRGRQSRQWKRFLSDVAQETLEVRQLLTSYYVDNLSDENTGAGSNGTLRWAIDQANVHPGDDSIEFSSASWPETITLTAANGPITIQDPSAGNLTINGPGQANLTISGGNETGIFNVKSATTINNLSIRDANGNGLNNGGAIYNNHSYLELEWLLFENNNDEWGGAVYNDGSVNGFANLYITNCIMAQNSGASGGAVCNYGGSGGNGSLNIKSSSFINNNAITGGAIFNLGNNSGKATIIISDSDFLYNNGRSGGAFYNVGYMGDADLQFTNCNLSYNTATYSGGAITNDGASGKSSVTLTNCLLSHNEASYGGAIKSYASAYYGNATVNISDSTLTYNTASVNGGAIFNEAYYEGKCLIWIKNSTINNNSASNGGAVYSYATNNGESYSWMSQTNANVIISDSKFLYNSATANGGTIFSSGYEIGNSFTWIKNSIINHSSASNGGAIYNYATAGNATMNIENSTLDYNSAQFWGECGVLYNSSNKSGNATMTIGNSTMAYNMTQFGVGIINNTAFSGEANLTITKSSLRENLGCVLFNNGNKPGDARMTIEFTIISDNSSNYVSAVYNNAHYGNSTMSITSSILANNTAVAGGAVHNFGAGNDCYGIMTITNTTLSNNVASYGGGAIYNQGVPGYCSLTIRNSTITNNSGPYGGAIMDVSLSYHGAILDDLTISKLTIYNSTIVNNNATWGGGVYAISQNIPGNISIYNSIVGNNTATSGAPDVYGNIAVANHTLFSWLDAYTTIAFSSGIILANPNIGVLGNYGGPTPTIPLLPGSPAIGAGFGAANATTDQRGYTPPSTYSANADMGAFQTGGLSTSNITITSLNEISMPIGMPSGLSIITSGGPFMNYSISAGNLPSGVTLNPSTGLLSGTPAPGSAGTYPITIQASNGVGRTGVQDFTLKVISTITSFSVSKGQISRSYIRYLTVGMDSNASALMLKNNLNRVRLTKADLSGAGSTILPLANFISVPTGTSNLAIDFGTVGLGNSRNTNTADGYYTLGVDLDGNGTYETSLSFYRILGDTNGDREVNIADQNTVLSGCIVSYNVNLDLNGDGVVNTSDYQYVRRSVGKKLKSTLIITN
jgi:hypothetical protein